MPANPAGPAARPAGPGADPAARAAGQPGDGLAAVFSPRRIALVGASDRAGSMGRLLWDNLSCFPGQVLPICRAASVGGAAAYGDLRDAPGDIDLAVIATPAAAVPAIIRSAGQRGVRAAIVLSAGFAETGAAGARLQDEAMAAARAARVRLVGPNCFGVQNADLALNASIAAGLPRRGGVSIVTQSGSYGMAVHMLGQDEGFGVAKVYAAGNRADITDAELLAYLREDPATTVICLLLESIPDGCRFLAEARRATTVKPVIAVISGRTRAGQRAAVSHTAALATDDAVVDAALRQAGVIRVRTGLAALDAARALSAQPAPRGPRAAIVTNSGGTGVELADLLADEGLDVPELSGPVQARLAALMPGYASARNPVDMTPSWALYPTLYPAVIELVARSGEADVVVAVLAHRAVARPVTEAIGAAVSRLRADAVSVPVCVCIIAPRAAQPGADPLHEAGVPCYAWPERTARAVGAAARYGAVTGRPDLPGSPGKARRPAARRRPWLPSAGLLDPDAGRELLAGAGIPVVETVRCASAASAAAAAGRLGYPVVAKVAHPGLVHKTDAGGVRLGLATAAAVRRAAAGLLALADGAAVLVQPQRAGIEVAVGGIRDPGFGPVVMTGLGGVLVEILGDVALAVAPVDRAQAAAMLRSLRGSAVFDGPRGGGPADLQALADVIARVSQLMITFPRLAELDLNPVLATADGCVAVDWRLRVG